ncbi:MAG: amino acid-binding protein [Eubacterium sp.]|nr:amino acid-binding protein [Eubacterium sp.]
MIRQVSAFIQNREGKLATMLKVLAQADVNIRSLTIAETADYGVVRLILQDTDKGLAALRDNHIMANETQVLAAEICDKPGGMSDLVEKLTDGKVNIEYAYSFLPQNTSNAVIIFKVREDDVERIQALLAGEANIKLLTRDELLMR